MKLKTFFESRKSNIFVYLFFLVTVVLYIPMVTFFSNRDDYRIGVITFLPVILMAAVISILAICIMDFALNRGKIRTAYYSLTFAISLAFYVQYNFLNPKFPELNGVMPNWSEYNSYLIISSATWILFIVICELLGFILKDSFVKYSGYVAGFLAIVQIVSLITVGAMSKHPGVGHVFLKDDQFKLGKDVNIVVFLVDACEYTLVQDYISGEDYEPGELDDFTFYYHAISGGGYDKHWGKNLADRHSVGAYAAV